MPVRYSDISSAGVVSHEGIARHYEDARISMMREAGKRLNGKAIDGGLLVRLVGREYGTVSWPNTITAGVGIRYVSERAYCFSIALFQDDRLISQSESVNVVVDSEHKPKRIIDQDREALLSMLVSGQGLVNPADRTRPEVLRYEDFPFQTERSVRFSDSDLVGHVNNVSVVRHYQDSLMELLLAANEPVTELGGHRRLMVMEYDLSYTGEAQIYTPLSVGGQLLSIGHDYLSAQQQLFQNGVNIGERKLVFGFVNKENQLLPLQKDHFYGQYLLKSQ